MTERQTVSINPRELERFSQIEALRPDLRGDNISAKVHVALQEWFKDQLTKLAEVKQIRSPPGQSPNAGKAQPAILLKTQRTLRAIGIQHGQRYDIIIQTPHYFKESSIFLNKAKSTITKRQPDGKIVRTKQIPH